jgi:hypothetical protein
MASETVDPPGGAREDDVGQLYREAISLRDEGRRHRAADLLGQVIDARPDWLEARLELAEILGDKRRLPQTVAELGELFRMAPDHARVSQLIDEVVGKRWMDVQIEPLVTQICDTGSGSEVVWLARLFAAVRNDEATALGAIADTAIAAIQTPRVRIMAAKLLARAGDETRARRCAAPMADDPRGQAFLAELDSTGERYLGSANVVIQRAPNAVATAIVFTGLTMEPPLPRHLLHAALHALGANMVTLTDPGRLLYMTGLPPLGDTFTETVEGLRALCGELGAPRLVFVGASGGSFAAIRYAVEMPEVDQLLITGPITVLDPTHPVMERPRARPMLERLAVAAPDKMENLRPYLEAREPPLPLVGYYGALHGKDDLHAANLAGVPGVTMCPLHAAVHDIADGLMQAGAFSAILADLVAGTLTPERARELARIEVPDPA